MKKILSMIFITVMMLSVMMFSATADNSEISVYLNATKIEFDVKPQIINGRTMVPIRAIFEKMGAFVDWDANTRTAICTKGETVVKMTVDSKYMYINNLATAMDVSPVVIDGRTLAPARYVAEAFGADVQWNENSKAVLISSKDEPVYKKVTLYALDGRTSEVPENEVEAYLNVGWYKTKSETQTTMYAADGRSITVYKAEISDYKNLGWYETKAEAVAANKHSTNQSLTDVSAADGNYYRTLTGKRYHLDPNCGGKNSFKTKEISGLTPCAKCAQ